MKTRSITSVGSFLAVLAMGLTLSTTTTQAEPQRSPGGHAAAYIHERALAQAAEEGAARVIVVLSDPALPEARARDWRQRGPAIKELARRARADAPRFRVTHEYTIFPFLAGTADEIGLKQLAASGVVEGIYPDREYQAVLSESGPLIGQPVVQSAGFTGDGIGVAVLDTGVDYTHPDLGGGGFPNTKVVGGYDFVNADSNPMDDNGHGTYCAGIVAGTGTPYRGIAPEAKIIALKVLNASGAGYSSTIISAINWCITHKNDAGLNIKVLSLSLSDSAEWRDPAECDSDPEGQAVSEAVDNGLVVAVAAGNEYYTQGVGMPACVTDAIAVGASWDSGTSVDTPADFSNRGELLDVYAPGIWITSARWSSDPEGSGLYLTGAGTSAAAPHVAGAAAVLYQMLGGAATPATVAARLARTGIQIVDPATGVAAPRIDLTRAMNNLPTSGPDLVVTAVTSTTAGGLVGAEVSLSISVRNQGDAASAACDALIALSQNGVASPQDQVFTSVSVPALSASQTWSSGTVSSAIPGLLPGTYHLVGFADNAYAVAEKDETNNGTVGAAFTVQMLSAYVQSSTIPSSLRKGESRAVSVTMLNDGSVPWTTAESFALEAVSPYGNTTWGSNRITLPVSSVAAGATVTFNFTLTAPATVGLHPCHWQLVRGTEPFGEVATGASRVRVIDDSQWGQAYASLDGDWTAYEDYSGLTHSAISAANLATGYLATMPDDIPFPRSSTYPYAPLPPYYDFDISYQMFPDNSGPWVAWMVDDYPSGVWNFQIAALNVQNLAALPVRVTYQDKDAMFPAIDGNLVVWEDYRNDPDGTSSANFLDDNPDIYLADLSEESGHFVPVYSLCIAPGPQFSPRISGDLVVWEDWRDGAQADLYVYDLSVDTDGDGIPNWKETARPSPDPAEIQFTATAWPEEYPDISGRTIVWMDLSRDTGLGATIDLYQASLDNPTPVAIATDPPTFRYHPRIDYPLIVWEDYSHDGDGPTSSSSLLDRLADNPDIYLHHLEQGFTIPIAAMQLVEEWPDVSGRRVVYDKHRTTLSDWPVFNVWTQQLPLEAMLGVVTFTDVPATYWSWMQVEAAVANGVVQGYPDGSYGPAIQVARDQMAVFTARALAGGDGNVPDGPATPSFSDVPSDYWAYKYIEYCADPAHDVVRGYADGTYLPTVTVTRGQMAAFIGRAMAGGDSFFDTYLPPGGPSFPDVSASYWAYKYIEYIADAGVTQGYPDGTYQPEVVVTRDQMAVYVTRAFGYL